MGRPGQVWTALSAEPSTGARPDLCQPPRSSQDLVSQSQAHTTHPPRSVGFVPPLLHQLMPRREVRVWETCYCLSVLPTINLQAYEVLPATGKASLFGNLAGLECKRGGYFLLGPFFFFLIISGHLTSLSFTLSVKMDVKSISPCKDCGRDSVR